MIIINLDNHSAKNDETVLIERGVPKNDFHIDTSAITFEMLEELYHKYKYSVPDSVSYEHTYFKALPAEQMSDFELIFGDDRQTAKENLEMTLLSGILNKSLTWPDPKKWFWQSEKDKDFVLLKKWFW